MNEKKTVVFGAGRAGKKILKTLISSRGCKVEAVLDNACYGYRLYGVKVVQAEDFLRKNRLAEYHFIIGGIYSGEMYRQLLDSRVSEKQMDTLTSFIIKQEQVREEELAWREGTEEGLLSVFDCTEGFIMGGVENWTYLLGQGLKERGHKICLFTVKKDTPPKPLDSDGLVFPLTENAYGNITENLHRLLHALQNYERVTFFLAHMNFLACMAMLLRQAFPEKVRVVSVIHSSLPEVILENRLLEMYVDAYFCVNHVVFEQLRNSLADKTKVFFKETPVFVSPLNRTWRTEAGTPVRIGYAARLEVEHKRSDLLLTLIKHLEELHCNYELNIAGEGRCLPDLEAYIKARDLTAKIHLYGLIPHVQMADFWNSQDIVVNVSETEGCSLSMLEAMACGCVPVVMDTLGTDWFIREGESGHLITVGDIKSMAKRICDLAAHRERLSEIGANARETVEKRCGTDEYIDCFETLLTDFLY